MRKNHTAKKFRNLGLACLYCYNLLVYNIWFCCDSTSCWKMF